MCVRWAPHGKTTDQITARRELAQDRCVKNAKRHLMEIVTGDETCTYYYDPLTKLYLMERTPPNQPRPEKSRHLRNITKNIFVFLNYFGVVSKSKLAQWQKEPSVTAAFHAKSCLKSLVSALRTKYPKSWHRGIFCTMIMPRPTPLLS